MTVFTARNWARLIVGVLLLQMPVAAQATEEQRAALRQSCGADYHTYCAGVPTGGEPAMQCLKQHTSELSQPCQTAVSALTGGGAANPPGAGSPSSPALKSLAEATTGFRNACSGEYRVFCQGVPPVAGQGLACMTKYEDRLSPGCKDAMAALRAAK